MPVYTTEITSDKISSDNPLHQRLLKAYQAAKPFVSGDVLEIGCGEGRGLDILGPLAHSYTAIDKIKTVVDRLQPQYPNIKFVQANIPPFEDIEDACFDTVIGFQIIEHIRDDGQFLSEISRVLRPGGRALITTPNVMQTLSRNPWHIREYTPDQLVALARKYFGMVNMKGISGDEKVMAYHERNRQSVNRIMKWDILNLQYRLPAPLLRIPYEILNRINRNKLEKADNRLVADIDQTNYRLSDDPESSLDLFGVFSKT